MKKLIYLSGIIFLLNACKKQESQSTSVTPVSISKEKLDGFIKETLIKNGRFDWSMATDDMIWSALQLTDNVVAIGYKPANENVDISKKIHLIKIKEGEWSIARRQILQLVYAEERKINASLTPIQVEAYDEQTLPVADVVIKNFSTLQKLRASNLLRYMEPLAYEPGTHVTNTLRGNASLSSSGCGGYVADPGLVNGVDYTTIVPNAKQSWNLSYQKIPQAWTKSTGSGIKLLIVDSGISEDQSLFGGNFNNGSSFGRSIEKLVTLRKPGFLGFGYGSVETSTNDGCGHGTAMAGVAAAPRSTLGGSAGIAYNCNLVTVRAATDVFLDESRKNKGVADAFVLAGNRSDVRIISISLGRITGSSQIGDAIDYAYNNGKLIFCAGGTSFDWSGGWFGVIFPANKSNVNAVTGVRDNNSRCATCHDGSEIDFTVVMEKSVNERHPLSTDLTTVNPTTVGGSSVATASCAGIAALVWSKNPGWSREQIVNKMIQSASNYPVKSGSFGWGYVDANAATN